jgi:cyclophilin family peptidyl-prolyl cis-trans isomerase/8-oxo-dGTP pyrophosphatase MutT (NUDIX family)
LFNANDRVFVAQRIDNPGPAWQMPQGGIDRGEDPLAAAWREMREEIGTDRATLIGEIADWMSYDLPPELASSLWEGRFRGQRQKWFAFRFLGTDGDIDINTRHPEFSAWRWSGLAELPDLIVPFKRALYKDLTREFKKMLGRANRRSTGRGRSGWMAPDRAPNEREECMRGEQLKVHDIAPEKLKSLTSCVMGTEKGELTIELYPEAAPNTVANFHALATSGFYDGLNFHRVIPGFVAQGGCPQGTGTGGPGWRIACETRGNPHKHLQGSLSMAHAGRDTGGSQFFLVLDPQPHLDGQHTVFGRVVKGVDVLDSIRPGDKIEAIRFPG